VNLQWDAAKEAATKPGMIGGLMGNKPDADAVKKAQDAAKAAVSVMCLVSARLQLPAGNVISMPIFILFFFCVYLFFFLVFFFPLQILETSTFDSRTISATQQTKHE